MPNGPAVIALIFLATIAMSGPAAAAGTPSIKEIQTVASDICARPDLYGYTRSANGKIGGHLSAPKLTARLANLGVELGVDGGAADWKGIPQSQLASSLADYRRCSGNMFQLMFKHFYPERRPSSTELRQNQKEIPKNSENVAVHNKIVVDCHDGVMPEKSISPDDRIYILYLPQNAQSSFFMAENFTLSGGVLKFHNEGSPPLQAYTCTVANYGDEPLLSVSIPAKTSAWKVVQDGNTAHISHDLSFQVSGVIKIGKIEVHRDKDFIFYIMNLGQEYHEFSFGTRATAVALDDGQLTEIGVRSTLPLLTSWPPLTYK